METDRFAGTSYQAANWIEIGQTKGRGRQDREHRHAKSVKAIYGYPLQADFRQRLGGVEPVVARALGIAEGWAQQEFGGAPLGDRRLSERLVHSARTLATMPGQAFSGVARGDWAAVKGYYRLLPGSLDCASASRCAKSSPDASGLCDGPGSGFLQTH